MTSPSLRSPLRLNDGRDMPWIGVGTYDMPDGRSETLVRLALELGYPAVDTASFYGNEAEVGRAVRGADAPPFLTTKLWRDAMGHDAALRAFDRSAKTLGLEALDLYLIHWPEPEKGLYVETWKALIRLRDEGRVRSIGVSNFTEAHLARIIDATGVVPAVNQVECHPRFQQRALKAFCRQHDIAFTAWSPLGRAQALAEPAIAGVATRHGRTPAQVVLRWHLQDGAIVIPKASSRERLAENLDLFDWALDEADMAAIAALDSADGRLGPDPDTPF